MKKINRSMFFSALVVLAYVLSACSGVPASQSGNGNDQSSQSGQVQEVVFTGTVDSMGGGQWIVSGQAINVDSTTSIDANIVVGDNVKVEALVGQDGSVTAVSIETSGADDTNANSNSSNGNDSNSNDNASNSNDNQGDNSNASNDNGNGNSNGNGNGNDNSSTGSEQEVCGVVEEITTDSITINGVVYMLADFTEFKNIIALGDQVKVHVIVNADGTITIREIEKSGQPGLGNDNSNSNDNGSDDNSNSNGNDDNSNDDNSNGNGNDDNSNDDNGNDDNGNDDNSNSNSNGNG